MFRPTRLRGSRQGQAHYSGLLYEHGGFVDDILVHKVADDSYFLCVNASNQDKDFEHIVSHNHFDCEVEFASPRYAQLAIQGPKALEVASRLTSADLAAIRYYWFVDGEFAGVPARIARTGYTGEDGFEVYVAPEFAAMVWNAILDAGAEFGIKVCGLGARNQRCASKRRCRSTGMRSAHRLRRSMRASGGSSRWIKAISWGAMRW